MIFGKFKAFHEVNIDLRKEIINDFLKYKEVYFQNGYLKMDIENKLKIALNEVHYKEILTNEHKKYFELINEIELSYYYYFESIEEDLFSFETYVSIEISDESVVDYITTGIDYTEVYPFSDWSKLESYNGVIEFIKNELSKFDTTIHNNKEIELDVEELNTKAQKIMMMKELGIIDFLIDKYEINKFGVVNVNFLANILNTFTGLGKETIRPTLNPIFNNTGKAIHKNNPYKNKKNIATVKAKMVELDLIE